MTNKKPQKSIAEVKSQQEESLLAIEGVEGVGIGEENNTPCIVVYVSISDEKTRQKIPKEIEGYHVKVETSGEFSAF